MDSIALDRYTFAFSSCYYGVRDFHCSRKLENMAMFDCDD
jgi:hypothetical protein